MTISNKMPDNCVLPRNKLHFDEDLAGYSDTKISIHDLFPKEFSSTGEGFPLRGGVDTDSSSAASSHSSDDPPEITSVRAADQRRATACGTRKRRREQSLGPASRARFLSLGTSRVKMSRFRKNIVCAREHVCLYATFGSVTDLQCLCGSAVHAVWVDVSRVYTKLNRC